MSRCEAASSRGPLLTSHTGNSRTAAVAVQSALRHGATYWCTTRLPGRSARSARRCLAVGHRRRLIGDAGAARQRQLPLYSTLLADRPAAGQRSTRLIVRLNLNASVPALSYRTSIGAAAATERIVNTLLQEGVRATVLTAHQLDAALAELGAGLAIAPPQPVADVGAPSTPVPAT
jgi:hypothetical protein